MTTVHSGLKGLTVIIIIIKLLFLELACDLSISLHVVGLYTSRGSSASPAVTGIMYLSCSQNRFMARSKQKGKV